MKSSAYLKAMLEVVTMIENQIESCERNRNEYLEMGGDDGLYWGERYEDDAQAYRKVLEKVTK